MSDPNKVRFYLTKAQEKEYEEFYRQVLYIIVVPFAFVMSSRQC